MTAKQLATRRKKQGAVRKAGPAPKPVPKAGARGTAAPYHHGSLHAALLQAAETILEREGLAGLTLRAAAREAGVSHAAPTHHFGDMTGLLSELAAAGFQKFGASLTAAAMSKTLPAERLDAMGEAYVNFARTYPGMFLLMFRSERLDVTRPALRDAMEQGFAALARSVSARREAATQSLPQPLAMVVEAVRSWSMVHGFAMLLLDRRLDTVLSHLPKGMDERDLLRAVLAAK